MSDRPYSRLYWELLSEFPDVARDCELMGAYALLLIGADMAWDGKESRPFLPRHIKDTTLARLVALDLVSVEEPTYAIRGLAKERARRSAHASKASNARWNARSNAESNARGDGHRMLRRDEHRQDETSSSAREADAFEAYNRLTGRFPSQNATKWLSRLIDDFTEERVEAALIEAHGRDTDPSKLLGTTEGLLAERRYRESKTAEQRRKDQPIRELQEIEERIKNASPEEREAAEKRAAGIREWMKGAVA